MPTIETSDLFRSAYLLALGADLIAIREPAEPLTFVFRGERVAQWDQTYQRGQALIGVGNMRHFEQNVSPAFWLLHMTVVNLSLASKTAKTRPTP